MNTELSLSSRSIVTLNGKSMSVSQWIITYPETIDTYLRAKHIKLDRCQYKILLSKLEGEHTEYFRKTRHLDVYIGDYYGRYHVLARAAYEENPIKFYKWWSKHPNEVILSIVQKIRLIDQVRMDCPQCLLEKHRMAV